MLYLHAIEKTPRGLVELRKDLLKYLGEFISLKDIKKLQKLENRKFVTLSHNEKDRRIKDLYEKTVENIRSLMELQEFSKLHIHTQKKLKDFCENSNPDSLDILLTSWLVIFFLSSLNEKNISHKYSDLEFALNEIKETIYSQNPSITNKMKRDTLITFNIFLYHLCWINNFLGSNIYDSYYLNKSFFSSLYSKIREKITQNNHNYKKEEFGRIFNELEKLSISLKKHIYMQHHIIVLLQRVVKFSICSSTNVVFDKKIIDTALYPNDFPLDNFYKNKNLLKNFTSLFDVICQNKENRCFSKKLGDFGKSLLVFLDDPSDSNRTNVISCLKEIESNYKKIDSLETFNINIFYNIFDLVENILNKTPQDITVKHSQNNTFNIIIKDKNSQKTKVEEFNTIIENQNSKNSIIIENQNIVNQNPQNNTFNIIIEDKNSQKTKVENLDVQFNEILQNLLKEIPLNIQKPHLTENVRSYLNNFLNNTNINTKENKIQIAFAFIINYYSLIIQNDYNEMNDNLKKHKKYLRIVCDFIEKSIKEFYNKNKGQKPNEYLNQYYNFLEIIDTLNKQPLSSFQYQYNDYQSIYSEFQKKRTAILEIDPSQEEFLNNLENNLMDFLKSNDSECNNLNSCKVFLDYLKQRIYLCKFSKHLPIEDKYLFIFDEKQSLLFNLLTSLEKCRYLKEPFDKLKNLLDSECQTPKALFNTIKELFKKINENETFNITNKEQYNQLVKNFENLFEKIEKYFQEEIENFITEKILNKKPKQKISKESERRLRYIKKERKQRNRNYKTSIKEMFHLLTKKTEKFLKKELNILKKEKILNKKPKQKLSKERKRRLKYIENNKGRRKSNHISDFSKK
jgi:hypothetical protein